ncbi:hypothetical protein [Streptosporangium saharense]|uniref:hypothetical protein n=1 Tax=Streptosporangium saharense TaxID=1706840 RepID=UPI003432E3B9
MILTTPGPPVDLVETFPWMDAYARTAVRLHPRPGNPTIHDSHIGGPLIWPVTEPWPACDQVIQISIAPPFQPGWLEQRAHVPESPVPMVGVAQFYARDIPEIPFPEGTDLFQVLWCPNEHDMDDIAGPAPLLVWRRSEDLVDVLAEPPMRHHATPDRILGAPAADLSVEHCLPRPCVLHPERVTEYPYAEELPEGLRTALDEWDDGRYQLLLSIAPGCKIGGWESWHLSDMYGLPCEVCGTETEPLLKLASSEWDAGSGPRWRPLEERHLEQGTLECQETVEPTTLNLGRYGALTIFLCPRSVEHGHRLTIQ